MKSEELQISFAISSYLSHIRLLWWFNWG